MTLLGLLATLTAGSGDPDPVEGYRTDLTPDWVNVVRVGPTRTHATIQGALSAVYADGAGGRISTSPSAGMYSAGLHTLSPRRGCYRTVLLLDPGDYQITGNHAELAAVDVVGATGNRDDVTITAGSGFVFNTRGDIYLAHLTMIIPERPGTTGKSYAVHMTWTNNSDLPTNNIYENVRIVDHDGAAPGGSLGWDGPDGSYLRIRGCLFEGPRGDVLHGDPTPTGFKIVVEDSTFNRPSAVVPFRGAQLWSVGNVLNGTPLPDRYLDETGTELPPPPMPTVTNGSIHPERWTPSTANTGPTQLTPVASPPSDLGPIDLDPGVIYYIPIDPAVAGSVRSIEIEVVSGAVALGLYSAHGSAYPAPADLGGIYGASKTGPGRVEFLPTSHWKGIYPSRFHRLFVGVLAPTGAQVTGSIALSTAVTCYRSVDATATSTPPWPTTTQALPSGTPVPWVGVNLY